MGESEWVGEKRKAWVGKAGGRDWEQREGRRGGREERRGEVEGREEKIIGKGMN